MGVVGKEVGSGDVESVGDGMVSGRRMQSMQAGSCAQTKELRTARFANILNGGKRQPEMVRERERERGRGSAVYDG